MRCQAYIKTINGQMVQCPQQGFKRKIIGAEAYLCDGHRFAGLDLSPFGQTAHITMAKTRLFMKALTGSTDDYAIRSELADAIKGGLRKLKAEERFILLYRFGLTISGQILTLQELGDLLGISRERVRQKESRALRRLRSNIPLREFKKDVNYLNRLSTRTRNALYRSGIRTFKDLKELPSDYTHRGIGVKSISEIDNLLKDVKSDDR